jgi:hypothetical protein
MQHHTLVLRWVACMADPCSLWVPTALTCGRQIRPLTFDRCGVSNWGMGWCLYGTMRVQHVWGCPMAVVLRQPGAGVLPWTSHTAAWGMQQRATAHGMAPWPATNSIYQGSAQLHTGWAVNQALLGPCGICW